MQGEPTFFLQTNTITKGRMSMSNENEKTTLPDDYGENLSDFALFLSVMKNKEAYECVLSIIMDEEHLKLAEVNVENVILNKKGKRAIRLDAWALDETKKRQFNTEMQNDITKNELTKRSRYYQSLIDSPILKSGRRTRYKNLPSTLIIFITQDDLFEKDLTMYTFTEQCEEIAGLKLEDGTKKIFLNMKSKNGRPELVSLLQYMKQSDLDNPEITVKDRRIKKLDKIVTETKQSTEWEVIRMDILDYGIQKGRQEGESVGEIKTIIRMVCKKIKHQKTPEQIADDLEEDYEYINNIYQIAQSCAPEYDCNKIYQLLTAHN